MPSNNSINTGPLASSGEATAGVNTRNLMAPSTLASLTSAKITTGITRNLGLSFSAGVLTLNSANGSALSAGNPGKVFISDSANFGKVRTVTLTANQSITISNLTGNLFGTPTGIAWTTDMPFFLYCAGDTGILSISRQPHHYVAVAPVGTVASALADQAYSLWYNSGTVAAGDAVVCIGSFRMTKNASDAWTVTALNETDGIERYRDGELFDMAPDQGVAGSYFVAAGAPVWTTSVYKYSIDRTGIVQCYFQFDGDGGTDGSGATTMQLTLPFDVEVLVGAGLDRRGGGAGSSFFAGTTRVNLYWQFPGTIGQRRVSMHRADTNALIINSLYANGDRSLSGNIVYFVNSDGV